MRRFDLAFPLTDPESDAHKEDPAWLVPQRLPDVQPKLSQQWNDKTATRLRYVYSALPEGLLPRFITRTYPLSPKGARWAHGVELTADDAQALVRADIADRVVHVVVLGMPDARRRLVGLARTELRQIHDDIDGLDPLEEIEVADQHGVWMPVQALEADERSKTPSAAATRTGTVPVDNARELDRMSTRAARDPATWKPTVFISYSSRDSRLLDELLIRLKPLKSEGLLREWTDRCIIPGQKWDGEIRRACREADVILLLISSTFEASDYIQDVEVKLALARAEAGEAVIVPVVLEKTSTAKDRWGSVRVAPQAQARPGHETAAPRVVRSLRGPGQDAARLQAAPTLLTWPWPSPVEPFVRPYRLGVVLDGPADPSDVGGCSCKKRNASCVVAPVKDQGGVTAVLISTQRAYEASLISGIFEIARAGATGETYAFNRDG